MVSGMEAEGSGRTASPTTSYSKVADTFSKASQQRPSVDHEDDDEEEVQEKSTSGAAGALGMRRVPAP